MKHLYSCGFNAHGQLLSEATPNTDIRTFTCMASASHIDFLDASWSQTVLRLDDRIVLLGCPPAPLRLSDHARRYASLRSAAPDDHACYAAISADGSCDLTLPTDAVLGSPLSDHGGLQAFLMVSGGGAGNVRVVIVSPGEGGRLPSLPARTRAGVIRRIAMTAAGVVAAVFVPDSLVSPSASTSGSDDVGEGRISTNSGDVQLQIFDSLNELIDHLITAAELSIDTSTSITTTPFPPSSNRPPQSQPRSTQILPSPHPLQAYTLHATSTAFILSPCPRPSHPTPLLTIGDARYPSALGRSVSRHGASRAAEPAQVDALAGLCIEKVVSCGAGGGLAGAVTEGGEGWIWGLVRLGGAGDPGAGTREEVWGLEDFGVVEGEGGVARIVIPPRLEGEAGVMLRENDGETEGLDTVEIVDIAVGDGHALVLDGEGFVWTCGYNEHGQLGRSGRGEKGDWNMVELFEDLKKQGMRAERVYCGDLTSFVVVNEI